VGLKVGWRISYASRLVNAFLPGGHCRPCGNDLLDLLLCRFNTTLATDERVASLFLIHPTDERPCWSLYSGDRFGAADDVRIDPHLATALLG
jgi:hypothetical protein